MARLNFFGHSSSVRGRRHPDDRLTEAGGRARRVAENIIEATYMAYESGTRYSIVDARRCRFRDGRGREIPRHSYASMARDFVGQWMASPGHRRNIVDPALRRHGAALAPNGNARLCGGVFAVQVFSD